MPNSSIRASAASSAGRLPWMSVITATVSRLDAGFMVARQLIPLTVITSIGICRSMSVDFELAPKTKRAPGEPCCEPVVYPDVEREHAVRMAAVAKALGDPIR